MSGLSIRAAPSYAIPGNELGTAGAHEPECESGNCRPKAEREVLTWWAFRCNPFARVATPRPPESTGVCRPHNVTPVAVPQTEGSAYQILELACYRSECVLERACRGNTQEIVGTKE